MSPDPRARRAFHLVYNMEAEEAIRIFEQIAAERPDDPYALNHLASAILFKELYRIGALDTELYSKNDFLDAKHLAPDPAVRVRLQELYERATKLCDAALKRNPNDISALYARGAARGLRSTYMAMVENSWFGALRATMGARSDQERVLQLDPKHTDAKMIVGLHNYVIGSLTWAAKIGAAVVGLSGNREKGLQSLQQAAAGGGEASIDAKFSLALFLRREQRYPEAIKIVSELQAQFPRNYLLALQHAHLLHAAGHGPQAIAAFRHVIETARQGTYFDPKLEQAWWGLGEAHRSQRHFFDAAQAYEKVGTFKTIDPELKQRAALAAGEMYDLLQKRDLAIERYNAVIATDRSSPRAARARKHLKRPYVEGS